MTRRQVMLLDYGAGNVRSVTNALQKLDCTVKTVSSAEDIVSAERLVFPGVGDFGSMMAALETKGFIDPLQRFLASGRPFLGICLGLQALFDESEEAPGVKGLGFLPGKVKRFGPGLSVPHIGWNGIIPRQSSPLFEGLDGTEKFYFVHSFYVVPSDPHVALTATDYGCCFVSAIQKGNVRALQFHPEKSGDTGLKVLHNFLAADGSGGNVMPASVLGKTTLAKRLIACLDVRSNDAGKLVVTKGDQYDVRENGEVRDFGRPVDLAERYYRDNADEITFLNITAFREFPLKDLPMLEVLKRTSENVFVPLTIGGGIRDYTDKNNRHYASLEVAHEYFRSGADKISIGSDAVLIAEAYLRNGRKTGASSIEQISKVYGRQAVVVSIDPRRIYVASPDAVPHKTVKTEIPGPEGERYCWYQCTIKGGREGRPLDAVTLAECCEALGAGEILLNCIDRDGTNDGFDIELIRAVSDSVSIPVIASSGAGCPEHFLEVFQKTDVEAALGAGIFHRNEVPIQAAKGCLAENGIEVRGAT